MFQKFTSAEGHEVLSPEAHKTVGDALQQMGKTSAADLSDDEREELQERLDNSA